jgi:hypothetical protein
MLDSSLSGVGDIRVSGLRSVSASLMLWKSDFVGLRKTRLPVAGILTSTHAGEINLPEAEQKKWRKIR